LSGASLGRIDILRHIARAAAAGGDDRSLKSGRLEVRGSNSR
jgi:hypothetical protein